MIELLTPAEMTRADAAAIAAGRPGIALMEAAGAAVARTAFTLHRGGPVLVVAGPGNNGGDGFVAARRLAAEGIDAAVALWGEPARLRGDAATARDRWTGPTLAAETPLPDAGLIVDALFGAGLDRPVDGRPAELIAAMNAHPAPVVSVDVPSGLDGATGHPRGACVEAAATATFFRRKPGHLLYPGRRLCGRLDLAQIGIPDTVLADIAPRLFDNAPPLWTADLHRPGPEGHKYTRGHTLVLSGPGTRTGAARLAARGALRAGSGLVTLGSPANALATNAVHVTAIMLRRIDDAGELTEALGDARFTAVALGPGLGLGPGTRDLVLAAHAAPQAAVIDADGITAFADDPSELFAAIAAAPAPAVLTPHAGEFARLFPDLGPGPERPRTEAARAASARSGAIVVMKGADTVIAAPDGRAAINANAPPWLATAGSGDVLTGIIAGLAAQGIPAFEAACAGVWLHGYAGTAAGPGMIAEDLDSGLHAALAAILMRPAATNS